MLIRTSLMMTMALLILNAKNDNMDDCRIGFCNYNFDPNDQHHNAIMTIKEF